MLAMSIVLFLGLTGMAMILAGSLSMYVDIASLLIIFPPAIAFTYASTSVKGVTKAFTILFTNDTNQSEQIYGLSKRVFTVLGNSGVILGIFMTLIGWVAIGANISDVREIGPAFGVSILTLLYGVVLKLLCYIAEQKVQTLSEY
ncbi:hypothetical protein [Aliikangiella sp. IMCC44359]|uniref:hypothetical protein n=1 Tax=Aliikangiella sp. IMCC44359 TaxID=3459125 RepID=UPI00403B364E